MNFAELERLFPGASKRLNNTKKYFIELYYPGFIFTETSEIEIPFVVQENALDLYRIAQFAKEKSEGEAFGFKIFYYLYGKRTDISGNIYFEGKVTPASEILKRTNEKESIMRSNIRGNGYKAILHWNGHNFPFEPEKDIVLNRIF